MSEGQEEVSLISLGNKLGLCGCPQGGWQESELLPWPLGHLQRTPPRLSPPRPMALLGFLTEGPSPILGLGGSLGVGQKPG